MRSCRLPALTVAAGLFRMQSRAAAPEAPPTPAAAFDPDKMKVATTALLKRTNALHDVVASCETKVKSMTEVTDRLVQQLSEVTAENRKLQEQLDGALRRLDALEKNGVVRQEGHPQSATSSDLPAHVIDALKEHTVAIESDGRFIFAACQVEVLGFDERTTLATIRATMAAAGHVVSCIMRRFSSDTATSRCVVVTYSDPMDAVRAIENLDNTSVDGKKIKVRAAMPKSLVKDSLSGVGKSESPSTTVPPLEAQTPEATEIKVVKEPSFDAEVVAPTSSSSSSTRMSARPRHYASMPPPGSDTPDEEDNGLFVKTPPAQQEQTQTHTGGSWHPSQSRGRGGARPAAPAPSSSNGEDEEDLVVSV